jgi:hypothetical protein
MSELHSIKEDLRQRIDIFEHEIQAAVEEKERAFQYQWSRGKARFANEIRSEHSKLKTWLPRYLVGARPLAVLTAPVIYSGVLPFLAVDCFLMIYQALCFSIYGIPRVRRKDYIKFDRGRLAYLNLVEKFNCAYCSYVNGLCAYATEVAARTEQHWCPIKHAQRLRAPHSRYRHFLDYGDAAGYKQRLHRTREDFSDLRDRG